MKRGAVGCRGFSAGASRKVGVAGEKETTGAVSDVTGTVAGDAVAGEVEHQSIVFADDVWKPAFEQVEERSELGFAVEEELAAITVRLLETLGHPAGVRDRRS